MILTFAEDFTSTVDLDSELIGTPESGIYWNRGVHPIMTVSNILNYLPIVSFTFPVWVVGTTYGEFDVSRSKGDIVTFNGDLYLSLQSGNIGNSPDVTPLFWLITNIESIRMRSFIWTVEDNFKSALTLDRKLIENQYIYDVGKEVKTLSGDFSGWAFEPKGSDYVRIRINQIALQATTTTPQNLYVINQGQLITTLTLNPIDGVLQFEEVGYTITGKGRFLFVIDSQDVLSENPYNDPLRYDGFVCYPVSGIGATPEDSDYSEGTIGNGLNWNISAYLDSQVYIDNNQVDFAKFLQAQFEFDAVRMFLHNSNNRSNRDERMVVDSPLIEQLLSTETLNTDMNTIARKYIKEKKFAAEAINRTFDKFLVKKGTFKTRRSVI